MKVSAKGEYGIKAVLHLCMREGEVVQIHEIAEREDIPLKYLEQILLALKNGGVVRSKRGVRGGYQLAKEPDRTTVGEVVRLLDGPLAPIGCVSKTAPQECPRETSCGIRSVWLEVRNAVSNILDSTSFAQIMEETRLRAEASRERLMYHI